MTIGYKEIPLTRGQVALVDDGDYADLSRFLWSAVWCKDTNSYYAYRNSETISGKRKTMLMHREILGLHRGDKRQGDHINGATLDNRRSNLRAATPAQNRANTGIRANNTSGFKGVVWHAQRKKWQARLGVMGKRLHLGYFDTPQAAHAIYSVAAVNHYGEFARTA